MPTETLFPVFHPQKGLLATTERGASGARTGLGKFEVTDIDPTIWSHIIYTFFSVTAGGQIRYLESHLDLPDNHGKGINPFAPTSFSNTSWVMIDYRLHQEIHRVESDQPEQ